MIPIRKDRSSRMFLSEGLPCDMFICISKDDGIRDDMRGLKIGYYPVLRINEGHEILWLRRFITPDENEYDFAEIINGKEYKHTANFLRALESTEEMKQQKKERESFMRIFNHLNRELSNDELDYIYSDLIIRTYNIYKSEDKSEAIDGLPYWVCDRIRGIIHEVTK